MWKNLDVKSLSLCSPVTSSAEENAVILTWIASPVSSCGSSGTTMLQLGMLSHRLPWEWCEVVLPGSAAREAVLVAALAAWRMRQEEGITVPLWRDKSDYWGSLLLLLQLPGLVCFAFLKKGCLASIQPSLLGAVMLASACTAKGHTHMAPGWGVLTSSSALKGMEMESDLLCLSSF